MTDEAHSSSDEEITTPSLEASAIARKRRLLSMKSRINGVEMREEDYKEPEAVTKKSKTDDKTFRSYQPINDKLSIVAGSEGFKELDVVEKEIEHHLKDTMDTKPIDTVDVTTLAPKKIDWDLKRDLEKKMVKLERRTQKAIAELIRQRLAHGEGDLANAVSHAQL